MNKLDKKYCKTLCYILQSFILCYKWFNITVWKGFYNKSLKFLLKLNSLIPLSSLNSINIPLWNLGQPKVYLHQYIITLVSQKFTFSNVKKVNLNFFLITAYWTTFIEIKWRKKDVALNEWHKSFRCYMWSWQNSFKNFCYEYSMNMEINTGCSKRKEIKY